MSLPNIKLMYRVGDDGKPRLNCESIAEQIDGGLILSTEFHYKYRSELGYDIKQGKLSIDSLDVPSIIEVLEYVECKTHDFSNAFFVAWRLDIKIQTDEIWHYEWLFQKDERKSGKWRLIAKSRNRNWWFWGVELIAKDSSKIKYYLKKMLSSGVKLCRNIKK